jgi:mycothiol synthase
MGDAAAAAALLVAAEQLDDTGEWPDAEDMTEFWTGFDLDAGRDGVAVCDASGLLVAFVTALAPSTFREAFAVYLEGRVRPDLRGRGIGRALLDWQLARGTEIHAERHPASPGQLLVPVHGAITGLERLVRREGFTAERWYRQMERPLTDLPDVPAVPGVELVPFTWDRDEEIRLAHNAAFTEHHGSAERDQAFWQSMFTGQRAFRPDLSVLAVEDGAVVGYLLAYVYEADAEATGVRQTHFGQIGVLAPARGRGVASALIATALRLGAENDCRRAGLDVDSDNVTGALRLYEKMGFTTARTRVSWTRPLPPLGEPETAR